MFKVLFSTLLGMTLFLSQAIADDAAPWERDDGFYETTTLQGKAIPCHEECKGEGICKESVVIKEISVETDPSLEEPPPEELPPIEEETKASKTPSSFSMQSLDHVVRRHAEQLKKITRLHWYGAKGINDRHVNNISIAYECYHALTVEQVRKLFVYTVETLLKAINSMGEDHPQLAHYPFNYRDLQVAIRFDNFFGQHVDRQYVKMMRMKKGIVEYHSFSCGQEEHGKKCCKRKERYPDSVDAVKLDLEYADRFRRIEERRTSGTLVDEAFPFTGVFK